MDMHISRAAIVGAGAMGGGIAQVITLVGLPVVIKDIDQGQLDAARGHVEGIYRRQVDRGKMSADEMREKLDLISYTLSYDGFEEVDIVIEAVPEDMRIKASVLTELNQACCPDAIFASNTSALSITEMGVASSRPHKMIGMHFFNPAHVMKLVEVIPGAGTDRDTVDTVERFARYLLKIPVIVRECPGFLVNRLLFPYLNEAAICLQEGRATAREIDAAMGRAGFGWPMGPFALMDMLGLDVCHHIIAYLDSQYGERMQEAALLTALFNAGRLGEKRGKGFYDYPGGERSTEVDALIRALQAGGQVGNVGSAFSVDRLMALLLNEAFLCVQERIASVDDVDIACIAGLGMQVRRETGLARIGPLAYADEVGLDVLLERFRRFESRWGIRFRPAEILVLKVRAGELGVKAGRGFKERERETRR
jgi:3-hydroxyacyl-CoA dehydrogenase